MGGGRTGYVSTSAAAVRPGSAGSVAPRASQPPLGAVTGVFRKKGPHNLSDATRALFPRPARAGRAGQIRTVLTSMEDELAVLSDRHAQLLREEQILEGRATEERERSGRPDPEIGTSERLSEVRAALAAVREAMASKGQQVVQLTTALHFLGATA